VGTPVVVNGSGFNDASAVSLNGTRAAFALESAAQLTLFVPRHAATGPIRVTTPNGTATSSARFTVTASPKRQVDLAAR
jgi:hypothetical protein